MPFDLNISTEQEVSKRYETSYDKQLKSRQEELNRQISSEYPKQEINIAPSKYDVGYLFNVQDPEGTLMEQRAQKQPWTAKVGLGLTKGLVITGTTLTDGIVGTATGLVNMAAEGKGSAFWDNPVSSYLNDINNKSDEWMPIYQTKASKNASFVGQMGYADFWGDKFLKNLGFTAGMVIDGMITGGVASEVLGLKTLASKLPKAIASATINGDRALGMAIQSENMINITPEIIKNAKKLDRLNKLSQATGTVLSVQGEARFEAINNSTQFYNDNKQKLDDALVQGLISNEDYTDKLDKLKKAQEGYGNADFLANTIILGIGKGIQFKNLFTKGFNPTKSIAEGITGSIEQGYKYSKPIIEQSAKIAKNILAEGVWEEQGQYTAQQASDDFYQKKFDGKKQDKIDDIFHSIYKGLSDSYGTRA